MHLHNDRDYTIKLQGAGKHDNLSHKLYTLTLPKEITLEKCKYRPEDNLLPWGGGGWRQCYDSQPRPLPPPPDTLGEVKCKKPVEAVESVQTRNTSVEAYLFYKRGTGNKTVSVLQPCT